jgi:hypothetical protein
VVQIDAFRPSLLCPNGSGSGHYGASVEVFHLKNPGMCSCRVSYVFQFVDCFGPFAPSCCSPTRSPAREPASTRRSRGIVPASLPTTTLHLDSNQIVSSCDAFVFVVLVRNLNLRQGSARAPRIHFYLTQFSHTLDHIHFHAIMHVAAICGVHLHFETINVPAPTTWTG